jgi:hypothetical protein
MKPSTSLLSWLQIVIVAAVSFCGSSCGDPPIKTGVTDWKPCSVGGPVEIRLLPPANQLYLDYENWLNADELAKARVYKLTLLGKTNQADFNVNVQHGDTPMGARDVTFVTFLYENGTNGTYKLSWSELGRQTPDFLKADEHPREIWVTPFGSKREVPQLKIVAIEGIETRGALTAMPGTSKRKN